MKIIEVLYYVLGDDGDYLDETYETVEEAEKALKERAEEYDEEYVLQCRLNLDEVCDNCHWKCRGED
jgi:hypothetical protein